MPSQFAEIMCDFVDAFPAKTGIPTFFVGTVEGDEVSFPTTRGVERADISDIRAISAVTTPHVLLCVYEHKLYILCGLEKF